MLLPLVLSCSDGRPSAVAGPGQVLRLDDLPFAELEVPPDTLPGHQRPTGRVPLDRGWSYAGRTDGGMRKYTTPVPFRLRGLFFYRPVPGMRLLQVSDGAELLYHYGGGRGDHPVWEVDRDVVTIDLPDGAAEPGAGDLEIEYPEALARELRLHASTSGLEPDAFARARIYDGIATREGLLLPAPGTVSWDVHVPDAAELTFSSGIVRPELGFSQSDGARFTVTVTPKGAQAQTVVDEAIGDPGTYTAHRVDLSRFSGQDVRITLRSDPAGTTDEDLVFFAEPVIATRVANPVTVLMVFIDTLRPDHLSLYGYSRDTSASIDHLKQEGAVFRDARSTAPWTLPSARSVLTGRYPEYWQTSDTLQQLLEDRGFATAFIAGNVYLTSNFDMDRDWDYHQVDGIWPSATSTTDDALAWLDAHDGRDRLLQVHYMDAHLPYQEPPSYRHRYAGDAVAGLPEHFEREDVRRAGAPKDPAVQQYVRDRYDDTIRYATDEAERLIERLDDNDILVVFSDHGEEFWEHGGHEHGHTVFDELLKVPLVIRAPGLGPSQPDAPVSLLDVTPTILDLVGAPVPAGLDGRSLVPLMRGEPGADQPFRERDLAFGHPLYGMEHWGVLHGDQKWSTMEGREALYDLSVDPGETNNLLKDDDGDAGAPFRDRLAAVLKRPVDVGYRLTPTVWKGGPPIQGLWTLCTVPGGFKTAWTGDEPLETSAADARLVPDRQEVVDLLAKYQITDHEVAEDAGGAEICWHPGWWGSREAYLVPNRPLEEVGREMKCSGYLGDDQGGKRGTMSIPERRDTTLGKVRLPLNRLIWDQRNLVWQFGIGPEPNELTRPLDGSDAEMSSMLQALGYVSEDVPPGAAPADQVGHCVPPAVPLPPMKAPEPAPSKP